MSPFSLILPEGGRSAIRKRETVAAFRTAAEVNRSREARGLPPASLLHRPTGQAFDVPGDADVLAMADAFEAKS